ncbi:hypothetical protein AGMMS49546_30390 [Spirochaetia bacterium]|nr:hypothetical protein AGMMS49546_30390 [Spirochaetia bacterium]
MHRKAIFLYLILMILPASLLLAADFGAVLTAAPEFDSTLKPEFNFKGTIAPWVSALISPRLNFYASAGVSLDYREGELKPVLVQLNRTELSWRPAPMAYLQFGRQRYTDSAALVAAGLFDGIHFSWGMSRARLSLGAFYTGLQYKEEAKIIMTERDLTWYNAKLNYDNMDTYFASRRVCIPLRAEFPDLTQRLALAVNAIAQIDVNGSTERGNTLHSQYLETQLIAEPWNPLSLTFAGLVSLMESEDTVGKAILRTGFAASAGANWEVPTSMQDMLTLQLRWTSGRSGDNIGAYLPLSGVSVGEVFTPRISALLYGKAAYTLRPIPAISVEGSFGYFVRTDTETLKDGNLKVGSEARTLGGEFSGNLIWAVQSDVQVSAGGGAFFPAMGDAFRTDTDVRWKLKCGVIVSF